MPDRVVLHRETGQPATLEPEVDNGDVRAAVARSHGRSVYHIGDGATPREVDDAIHRAGSEMGAPLPRRIRGLRRRRYQ